MQRWQSMKAQQWYYFKPTPQTLYIPMLVLGSVAIYAYAFYSRRTAREKNYRAGNVSYRDRKFKFI
jgi:NADH dehydrogenase (ubiquinone) 1 beta subcomplex subunit 4